MIKINRPKAEAITADRLRFEREPALKALDLDFMRAIERGEDTAPIVEQKQQLRDLPTKDLSALTLDELAALDLEKALVL